MSSINSVEKKKIFFPNLDGLRFFCFLLVFLFHSFHTEYPEIKNSGIMIFVRDRLFGNGNLGVNFFFVLSGFLITFLLIKEKELTGRINLLFFWVRRILRIWPLYFFCVVFGFFIFPLIKEFFGQKSNETANIFYYLTFTNNFDFIKNGLPDASVLGVLWSVAIEEQFYFVWPVLLIIIPFRWYPLLFTSIITLTFVFRAYYDLPNFHEYHTFSCIGDMAIGSVGAYLSNIEKYKLKIVNLKKPFITAIYIAFLGIFFFREQLLYTNYYVRIFERSFIALVMLIIILEQNFCEKSLFKFSDFKLISKLGIISYGLYCLHFIGILITLRITGMIRINTSIFDVLVVEPLVSLIITIIIATISYTYFEKFFLRLKMKFSFINK